MIKFYKSVISLGLILALTPDVMAVTIKNSCSASLNFEITNPGDKATSDYLFGKPGRNNCARHPAAPGVNNGKLTVGKDAQIEWQFPTYRHPLNLSVVDLCDLLYNFKSTSHPNIKLSVDKTTKMIECKMDSSSICQCQTIN